MSKPVILTGLRANNDLHIGNYLGALLPIVDMAKTKAGEYQVNLFVPDLHSFTTPIDHSALQEAIMNNLRVFVAAGLPLDNPDVHIYRQSYVPAHSELTWILDCFTGFGEMRRMTQFKDKAQSLKSGMNDVMISLGNIASQRKHALTQNESIKIIEFFEIKLREAPPLSDYDSESIQQLKNGNFNLETTRGHSLVTAIQNRASYIETTKSSVGLFNYPVLMAADILLYGAKYVPVGDDQTQHLEFTRNIATRMNATFGDLFVVPESVKKQHEFFGKDQGLRVKDLVDPSKKMSKSDQTGKGVIFLTDSPEIAKKKIMSATTDSIGQINYDYDKQPGISSLIDLLALLKGDEVKEVVARYGGQAMYGPLKTEVGDVVAEFLSDFQSKLTNVNDQKILEKLQDSEAQMYEQANATLLKVQKAVGLR